MEKNTGGPAFPTLGRGLETEGMTLRDYFAAKAMQGHIVASMAALYKAYANTPDKINQIIAQAAYELADAMMKARQQ